MTSTESRSESGPRNSNLLSFDSENENARQVRDINHRLGALESALAQLDAAVAEVERQRAASVEKLSDETLDLNTRVAETYQRLGEMEQSYRQLNNSALKIDAAILRLSDEVDGLSQQTAERITALEEDALSKHEALGEQQRQLAARLSSLAENARSTTSALETAIDANARALLELEKHLREDIDALASRSREQHESLSRELEAGRASVLKLQQVDEAILRRATTLEISSEELKQQARQLSASVAQLEDRSDELSGKLVDLMVQVQHIEDEQKHHTGLIEGLQNNFIDMTHNLAALVGREQKHFRLLSAAFFLALLAVTLLYFYQDASLNEKTAQYVEADKAIQTQLHSLDAQDRQSRQSLAAIDAEVARLNHTLDRLDDNVDAKLSGLADALRAQLAALQKRLANMNDKVQTLDGQLAGSILVDPVGKDNIIHGEHWLAEQPAQNYVLALATVSDRKALYEIAQRYSDYLQDKLSYTRQTVNGRTQYTLLYGNFASSDKAKQALADMPYSIEMQRPRVKRIGELVRM